MSALASVVGKPFDNEFIAQVPAILKEYPSSGPSSPLEEANIIRFQKSAVEYLSSIEDFAAETDCQKLEVSLALFQILRGFTFIRKSDLLVDCYASAFLNKVLGAALSISQSWKKVVESSTPVECTKALALQLQVRTAALRVVRNLANIGIPELIEYILSNETQSLQALTTLLQSIIIATPVNVPVITSILEATPTLNAGHLVGVVDIDHITCIFTFIASAEPGMRVMVAAGVVGWLYLTFISVVTTPTSSQRSTDPTVDFQLIDPFLFHTQDSSLFQIFGLESSLTDLNLSTTDTPSLYGVYRLAAMNTLRPIHIMMLHAQSKEEDLLMTSKCFPESISSATKNLNLSLLVVEYVFTLLAIGVTEAQIPIEISRPVDTITSMEKLFNSYVIHTDQQDNAAFPNGFRLPALIGYHSAQLEKVANFCSRTNMGTGNQAISAQYQLPSNLSEARDVPGESQPSIFEFKRTIVDFLSRYPFEHCVFFYLHQSALTYIWELFDNAVNTLLPVTMMSQLPPSSQVPVTASANAQTIDVLPPVHLLRSILTASFDIEAIAQKNTPVEQLMEYASMGLTSMANVVKALIFGPYADPAYQTAEDIRRNALRTVFDGVRKARQKFAQEQLEAEENIQDADVPDDFESFADGSAAPRAEKKAPQLPAEASIANFVKTYRLYVPGDTEDELFDNLDDSITCGTNMVPAGAISEIRLDPVNNTSLKSRVLLMMMYNGNTELAWEFQEILWNVAYQNSTEFIRLCGFGRSIGLLANKNLPGFGGFAQNAINIGDMFRQ